MRRLNRIQSIVFETAYNTNENRKNNIEKLTILNQIRQNNQKGFIKKNEFKVGN